MGQLTLFDYSGMDPETRIVVQQRTSEIKGLMRRAAQDIVDIGLKLIEVKERLGHGGFEAWLGAEFGWSDQTARRFMHVAKRFGQNQQIVGFEPSALYLLSAPSTPDAAREQALEHAASGQPMTHTKAKEIVAAHKPPQPPPDMAESSTEEDDDLEEEDAAPLPVAPLPSQVRPVASPTPPIKEPPLYTLFRKAEISPADAATVAHLPEQEQAQVASRGPEAVKEKAAEMRENAPPMPPQETAEQEAKAKVGERWHRIWHDLWMLINSVRDVGGIERIAAKLDTRGRQQYASDAERVANELVQWAAAMRRES